MAVRNYLSAQNFVEVELPLPHQIHPEGARDFVVPSRMNPDSFMHCRNRHKHSSNC